MVRIVHTADVHLRPDAPERRAALAEVLDRAEAVEADAVTIGGDLFDDPTAAGRLRPELRSLFADRPFPVVVIPGNHDSTAFDGDAFFGPAVRPATAEPFEAVSIAGGAARLLCLPYAPELPDDVLVALRERDPVDGLDCLLVHCSLEAPAVDASTGDEAATRYCPVTRGGLAALDFDVVLAGHYHGANRVELPAESGTGGTFVYSGTPASVTAAETGRRRVAVVDDAATPTVALETIEAFHYDELARTVRPGEGEEALDEVRERAATWAGHDVEASVTVEGFVDRAEAAFDEALRDALADGLARGLDENHVDDGDARVRTDADEVPVENHTRSVAHLLDHPIYREFEAHLDAETALDAVDADGADPDATDGDATDEGGDTDRPYDPDRLLDDARERVLAAMADLAAGGELS